MSVHRNSPSERSRWFGEKFGKKFGKTSARILELLRQTPEMTIPDLAETLAVSTRAVEKQIAKLREEGRIRRVGAAKGGH